MRTLALLAIVGVSLTTLASAQALPLANAPNNNGNIGGGIYFNLTVNQITTINSIDYWCRNDTVGGPFQSSFNLFVGPSTWVNNVAANPGPWVLVGSTTPLPLAGSPATGQVGPTTLLNGVLNPAGVNPGTITFLPGTYGIALQATGHSWRYQNFAALTSFTNPDMTVTAGGASNGFLALPTFSPRVICGQVNYTLGGTPMQFAQREPYGEGCYKNFMSFYELFPSSAFVDMSNKSMYLTYDGTGNRYSAVTVGTTPVNTAIVTSPSLNHTDDLNITVNLANSQPIIFPNVGGPGVAIATVEMCSNGYVNLLGTTPATSNPTVAAWLTGTAVRIGNHYDLDPAPAAVPTGTTNYDYDAANSAHVFSWINVPTFGIAATSNTFQMVFFANGDVEMRWGVMSVAGGGGWPTLIGFTPGVAAADPGSIDLSAAIPFSTSSFDQPPLTLTASANPILNTTVNLTTSNTTPGPNLGLCFVTVADLGPLSPAGLNLAVIGAPGCVANVDINAGVGNLITNLGSPFPGLTTSFQIPAGPPAIIGQSFYSQSAWLDATQNPAGIITSNAVKLKVGAF
jgi:hypothetical protein